MKKAVILLALLSALPLRALEPDACRGSLTHLGTLYELRTLMMKSPTFDVAGFATRRIAELSGSQPIAPTNPAYSTIRMLQRVHDSPDAATVDAEIAALERELFPAASPLPMLTITADLRRADELMRSEKPEDRDKGLALMKDAARRLR